MRVGASKIEITPPMPVELAGYIGRLQPALRTNDPLWTRALYLANDSERMLWLHADVVGVDGTFADEFRSWAAGRFGLPRSSVILSASHSHASPTAVHFGPGCGAVNPSFVEFLRGKIRAAAEQAVASPVEARLIFAEGQCNLAIDRRRKASAHRDPRIPVLAWQRPDHSLVAVMCNYAIHNVGFSPRPRLISSDITGHAAADLEHALPGSPVVLFSIGPAGNINPPGWTEDPAQVGAWGNAISAQVRRALETARPSPETFAADSVRVDFQLDVFDEARIASHAEAYLAEQLATAPPALVEPVTHAIRHWQARMTDLVRRGAGSPTDHAEISFVRLGDIVFVGFDFEVFSRMADELRAATGRRVYVVGYANGLHGYLPHTDAYPEGGYEVDGAFIFYDSWRPKRGAFEALRDQAAAWVRSTPRR